MDYNDLSRIELLRQIYDKMSEDEKKMFVLMHLNGNSNSEIMQALQNQQKQLSHIEKETSFVRDLGANVAGNALYGGVTWLLGRLLKVIK